MFSCVFSICVWMCFTFLHGSCWLLLFATGSDPRRGDGSLLRCLSDLMPVIADQSRCDDPTQSCDQSPALRSPGHARGKVWQVRSWQTWSMVRSQLSHARSHTAWKSHRQATAFTRSAASSPVASCFWFDKLNRSTNSETAMLSFITCHLHASHFLAQIHCIWSFPPLVTCVDGQMSTAVQKYDLQRGHQSQVSDRAFWNLTYVKWLSSKFNMIVSFWIF